MGSWSWKEMLVDYFVQMVIMPILNHQEKIGHKDGNVEWNFAKGGGCKNYSRTGNSEFPN